MSGPVVLPPTPLSSSSAKFWPTFLLALFFGIFGIHRFYLKSPKRFLMLFTLGGFGIWTLIDVVTVLLGKFKDGNGVPIANPSPIPSWGIFIVLFVVSLSNNSASSVPFAGEWVTSFRAYGANRTNILNIRSSGRLSADVFLGNAGKNVTLNGKLKMKNSDAKSGEEVYDVFVDGSDNSGSPDYQISWNRTAPEKIMFDATEYRRTGVTGSKSTNESSSAVANLTDARDFTEKYLTSRYGRVMEISQSRNGSYAGFPNGSSVYTFSATVLRDNTRGGHPTRNVVIAVEFDGREWKVVKSQVD